MFILYKILSFAALILYLPFLFSKKGPEDKKTFILERLGRAEYAKTDIWVHSVSVGETLACMPFLKKLKAELPEKKITLSTTTYTGQNIANERFPEADRIMYVPIDTPLCVNKAVNSLKPDIFITIETELWPVLFGSLKDNGSKVIVLNGRLSANSFKGYNKIKFMLDRMFSNIDRFCMQGQDDADRILALGAEKGKVSVMGNFKFDLEVNTAVKTDWLDTVEGRILLAASTHRGEDEIILEAYRLLKNDFSDLVLIIAPRHPERFNEVADLIGKEAFKYIRRSTINGQLSTVNDIILLDTIGELSGIFSKSDIAFIGGSLVPIGGHNILEPAFWSKPIIFGPHMDNFPIADAFIKESGAIEIRTASDISKTVQELLDDPQKASSMGQNAKAIFERNRGAVEKAIAIIRSYLGTA